jgi:F0F1-type ATP synthase membrane subunit c/vacuolar-type H+-ATPase subunit K
MMDGGAGLAIGMSCGIGAGIGSGIAIGRAGLQQEMEKKVKELEASYSIQIKDQSGNQVAPEDFVRILTQASSCVESSGKQKKILLAIGVGLLVAAGMFGVLFFLLR